MAHELPGSAALGHEKTQTSTTAVTRETGQSTGAWVTHAVTPGIDRDTGETRVTAWTLLRLRRWGGSPKHVTVSVKREQDTSERPRPGGHGTTTGTHPNPEYPHSFPEAPALLYIQPLGPTHHRCPITTRLAAEWQLYTQSDAAEGGAPPWRALLTLAQSVPGAP